MHPPRRPSFRQAIEDGRARRLREADRARTRGISSGR